MDSNITEEQAIFENAKASVSIMLETIFGPKCPEFNKDCTCCQIYAFFEEFFGFLEEAGCLNDHSGIS